MDSNVGGEDKNELSIICSSHSCLFNYIQLSLQKSFKGKCETCWNLYGDKPSKIAIISCPFYKSRDVEYDLIIVPAKQCSFSNSITDLHIAVGHKFGLIMDFDKNGLHYERKTNAQFEQCLRLHLIDDGLKLPLERSLIERRWDDTVSTYLDEHKRNMWLSSNYHSDGNNCFDFVLDFVATLRKSFSDDVGDLNSKDVFCKRMIRARIEEAVLYLNLRRSIVNDDGMIFARRDKATQLIAYLGGLGNRD